LIQQNTTKVTTTPTPTVQVEVLWIRGCSLLRTELVLWIRGCSLLRTELVLWIRGCSLLRTELDLGRRLSRRRSGMRTGAVGRRKRSVKGSRLKSSRAEVYLLASFKSALARFD